MFRFVQTKEEALVMPFFTKNISNHSPQEMATWKTITNPSVTLVVDAQNLNIEDMFLVYILFKPQQLSIG